MTAKRAAVVVAVVALGFAAASATGSAAPADGKVTAPHTDPCAKSRKDVYYLDKTNEPQKGKVFNSGTGATLTYS